MAKTRKDRHDNDVLFAGMLGIGDDESDVEHDWETPLPSKRPKRFVGKAQSNSNRVRRPQMWDDDWSDPENDLMFGFKEEDFS